ncbi:MAG: DeoR/GlpR family DNA-binding transcription regulator [bacterium]|nr:DeoR/GlpR family DNA-binding transcription regulator [bacterium]
MCPGIEDRMIPLARHEQILSILGEHDVLSVTDAVARLGASPATIRRDFHHLAERGLVVRARGGVKVARPEPDDMVPFALREVRFADEKKALARHAAGLLAPGDTVLVDGGTTTFMLAAALPPISLRVITNSVRLAAALEELVPDRARLEIYLTGGFLYPNSGLLLGPSAQASLAQYHAHWAFLSVGGITAEGIYNTSEWVVETERVMMASADRVAILADHSKIGRHAMCRVAGLDRIGLLITDAWPANREALEEYRAGGVEVVEVDVYQSVME